MFKWIDTVQWVARFNYYVQAQNIRLFNDFLQGKLK